MVFGRDFGGSTRISNKVAVKVSSGVSGRKVIQEVKKSGKSVNFRVLKAGSNWTNSDIVIIKSGNRFRSKNGIHMKGSEIKLD